MPANRKKNPSQVDNSLTRHSCIHVDGWKHTQSNGSLFALGISAGSWIKPTPALVTHIGPNIYIYINVCVCVCVCEIHTDCATAASRGASVLCVQKLDQEAVQCPRQTANQGSVCWDAPNIRCQRLRRMQISGVWRTRSSGPPST